MKITTNKIISAMLLVGVLFINSCKKEETLIPQKAASETEGNYTVLANQPTENGNSILMIQKAIPQLLAAKKGAGKNDEEIGGFDCATVTFDTVSYPHLAYIDFGPGGCTGSDGVLYQGNITIQFTDEDFESPGTSWSANFRNYSQDSVSINGTLSVSNDGYNASGNLTTTANYDLQTNIISEGMSLNGRNVFYSEEQERDLSDPTDNIILITGGGYVNTAYGNRYNQDIITPLQIRTCTNHFVIGTVELSAPGIRTRTIDYGPGTCDNKATITSGTTTRTIILD